MHRTEQTWCIRARLLLQTEHALEWTVMHQHSASFTAPKQQCKPVYHLHTLLSPKGTRWLLQCRDRCSLLKIGTPGKLLQLMSSKETFIKVKSLKITTFQIFHPNRLPQQSHESELQTKQQHCEQAKHEQNFHFAETLPFSLRSSLRAVTWKEKSLRPPGLDFFFFTFLYPWPSVVC